MSNEEREKMLRKISRTSEYSQAQKDTLRHIYKMTPAEGFQSLVKAGIYNSAGVLMPKYRSPR